VNADEVTIVEANHREARLVGPLLQNLLAHMAQLGRLGPCEEHWRVNLPVAGSALGLLSSLAGNFLRECRVVSYDAAELVEQLVIVARMCRHATASACSPT